MHPVPNCAERSKQHLKSFVKVAVRGGDSKELPPPDFNVTVSLRAGGDSLRKRIEHLSERPRLIRSPGSVC